MLDAKQKILHLLRSERPDPVSGELICRHLNVSRTAIWKNIEALRRDGYEIEAKPRSGYRLISSPDILAPSEWQTGLKSKIIGREARYFKSVSSTNDAAKELARLGAKEGTTVLAEEQTSGKGRLGRVWRAPSGAWLSFSIILYPKVNPMEVSQLTMLGAVAVVNALKQELGVPAGVKWPNDVYLQGLKVCGILAEMAAEADQVKYLVLGIGVNVNQRSEDLGELIHSAISLRAFTGRKISRSKLLGAILEQLDFLYDLWQEQGFAPVRTLWKENALWLESPVQVSGLHEVWQGLMEDIDAHGALVLRLADGSRKIFHSGEVSLRPGHH